MNHTLDRSYVATSGESLLKLFKVATTPDRPTTHFRTKERTEERTVLVHTVKKGFPASVDQRHELPRFAAQQDRPPISAVPTTVPELVVLPRATRSPDQFRLLQKFEAVVVERFEDSFIARFSDPSRDGIEEEAEIAFDEISESDLPLVQPGAVFYWNIGYERKSFGQVSRVSLIRFRRLPPMTDEEIEGARIRASMLHATLKRNSDPDPAIA